MDLRRFDKLQRDVERLQREQARAEGALEQILKKLYDDHACDSLSSAQLLAEGLKVQLERAEQEFNAGLDAFEAEYGDLLRGEP